MNNREFALFKKRCLHSKGVYERMKDGTFINDKSLMAELMDDTQAEEDKCEDKPVYVPPRIGDDYQVKIKSLGHTYNLRPR